MGLEEKLKALPNRPGVYLFRDAEGTLLYVGKALSLRKRVLSYFRPARSLSAKVMRLREEMKDLEWIVTGSEAEALLYENALIKEHTPKFNVSLRDDKSYPYLKVTVEEEFPRIYIGRGTGEPGIKTIGPFTQARLLRQAMNAVRRVIPFRTCRTLPSRACLDYHLKLCSAPCEGRISRQQYAQALTRVFRLMEGKKQQVLRELERGMRQAAGERRYEEAARFRDQIQGLLRLSTRPRRFIPSEALADLQSVLRLKTLPRRIEGFDVSNVYGRQAVGSMVRFFDGKPDKGGYKRFRIKTVRGIDDYAMMREIVRRRCEGACPRTPPKGAGPLRPSGLPDLILIDGGRGHLSAALEVLKELRLELPAAGIAKEHEALFLPGQREPIILPPDSKALQILQRVRDEAHRFAIGYHRLLRGKQALASALDRIPGVGPRKKQDLLARFGSVEAMRRARPEELAEVRGISGGLADRIHHELGK